MRARQRDRNVINRMTSHSLITVSCLPIIHSLKFPNLSMVSHFKLT